MSIARYEIYLQIQFSLVRLQTFKNVTCIVAKYFKMVSETKRAGINTSVLGLMSCNAERLYMAAVNFRSLPPADEWKVCSCSVLCEIARSMVEF